MFYESGNQFDTFFKNSRRHSVCFGDKCLRGNTTFNTIKRRRAQKHKVRKPHKEFIFFQ